MTELASPISLPTSHLVLRHGLPGLLGTTCVAVGALGVGWLPGTTELLTSPIVDSMRSSTSGSMIARSLVLVGLAVLLQSWLLIGADLLHFGAWPVRQLRWVLLMWAAPLFLAPPLFSRDVYSYYAQGRLFEAGSDPTTVGVGSLPGWFDIGADPMWTESPTPYGPAFLFIERTVASIAHPNAYLAGILLRFSSLIGLALLAVFLPKLAKAYGVDGAMALWVGVLNPLVIMHFVSGAHNDALMVGLTVLAVWLGTRNQCLWAAALVGLAATVKPIGLIALPFIGLQYAGVGANWARKFKSWILTGLAALAVIVAMYLFVGAGYGVLSAAFGTPGGVLTWLSPTTAIGQVIGGITTVLGITGDAYGVIAVIRTLGTVLSLGAVIWLLVTSDRRTPLRGLALAFGAVVLLGAVVHPWYVLWALPLFAASGLNLRERRIMIIVTIVLIIHGMIESSTAADNVWDVTDVITFLLALATVAIISLASPRERALVLGVNTPAHS
ncbi:MAG: polyprenol phosphomannose-dependent alpha 1,6 mannosyltransferase MptB [Actinomycetota bacterium]|nr:polyprenol phosphomannose-dependent alpha 1,6 mannosyltransferase MptB [Actinomycetota bacterium]